MNKEIRRLGIKISRQESDRLHDRQFQKNFKKYEYKDFIDACLKCFEEGYKLRGIQDVNKLAKLHNQERK